MSKSVPPVRHRPDHRSRASHIGDYPLSAVLGHLVLGGLLCVDVATMRILIAGASNESDFVAWVLALGLPFGLALIAYWAAEVTMRYVVERRRGPLIAAVALALAWAGTIVTVFLFRKSSSGSLLAGTDTGSGVHIAGQSGQVAANPGGSGGLQLSLMLTAFLILTSIIAFAMGAMGHDPVQKRRRQVGRRLLALRARRRAVERRRHRANSAAQLQRQHITDLEQHSEHAVAQLPHRAVQLKAEVRTRIAKALADPAATSDLHNATPVVTTT